MQRLREALRSDQSTVPLDLAALELATVEFPGLDIAQFVSQLDDLASQINSRLNPGAAGRDFVLACNELLFDVFRFRGNQTEYYDPRNSCLNAVLSRKLGIPISLSVIYIEIARRLNRPVQGIGLPGHFIVVYNDVDSRLFLDPFHSGRILSIPGLATLAKETGGVDILANPAVLAPVTNRQILIRMLSNLKVIYLRGESFAKALQVLDLLIEAMPDYPGEYRHRGLIHLRLQNHSAAKSDLETYLRLDPDSSERSQVEEQLKHIGRLKASLN